MQAPKAIVAIAASAALALTLAGCASNGGGSSAAPEQGSQPPAQEQKKAPLSLDGKWKQTNSNNPSEAWMEANISGDVVTVNYIAKGGDTEAVFWVGSYEAPTTSDDSYSFTSTRDAEATKNSFFASTDDTKDFEYADGVLSFKMTWQGTTSTIKLERE